MAKKSLIIKCKRLHQKRLKAIQEGKKMKFPTRIYHRCALCGRPRGYIGKYDMCRICIRQLASENLIMGLKKASW